MKAAIALLALLALAGSAHASECYCNTLRDFCAVPVTFGPSICTPPYPTAIDMLPGYTFNVGQSISGVMPLAGSCFVVTVGTTMADLAFQCDNVVTGCAGFTLDYVAQPANQPMGGLQVCYWADMVSYTTGWNYGTCSPSHEFDQRCYGTWVKNTPVVYSPPPAVASPPPPVVADPPPCASPPPPVYQPVCVAPEYPTPCDCTAKYGAGTLAESKCMDCKRTRPDAGDLCCSCRPNVQDYMTVICIDCVVTAHPAERKQCDVCNCKYPDSTNGLVRCFECTKLANDKDGYVNGYPKKYNMCHDFCGMLPMPNWPGMTDPSQCLDCVKDWEAGHFTQVPGNPNGQCPMPGRRSRHFL